MFFSNPIAAHLGGALQHYVLAIGWLESSS